MTDDLASDDIVDSFGFKFPELFFSEMAEISDSNLCVFACVSVFPFSHLHLFGTEIHQGTQRRDFSGGFAAGFDHPVAAIQVVPAKWFVISSCIFHM